MTTLAFNGGNRPGFTARTQDRAIQDRAGTTRAGQTLVVINQISPILVRFPVSAAVFDEVRRKANQGLLVQAAPFHVTGVREYLLDLVSPDDFAAVGRVFDAVSNHLVECHPAIEMRNPPTA